jgi:putative transcriptional regulator
MTALRHHPHGETLMSHAAGALDPALSVVLRCHLQFCERCRAHLRALDNVGGAFLEGLKAPEDEDFFGRTKDRFAGVFAQEAGSVLPPIALDPDNEVLMPAPLARATGLRRETIPWIKMPHGFGQFDLPKFVGAAATSRIVHIGPDAILHSERHGGQLIVVLLGAYDYDGDRFERGDLHDVSKSGFKTFKGASPEGVTFFTAIRPIPQLKIFRTGH